MSTARTIPNVGSLSTFTILVNGDALPRQHQVASVLVENELNRIPTAKLTLIDGNAASQNFDLSNEDYFVPGSKIVINSGYDTDETTIFEGIVIKQNLKIREGSSLLIVECKDLCAKLTLGRKSKIFYDMTDSEIVEEILDAAGIEHEIEATSVKHAELIQFQISDWDFIVTRMQQYGLVCYAENGNLMVSKPKIDADGIFEVVYGATLLDLDAEIDTRHHYNSVNAISWNFSDQEVSDVEANNPNIQLSGNLSYEDLSAVFEQESNTSFAGASFKEDFLQTWVDAKMLFNQLAKVRGRAKFSGVAEVKPNLTLNLGGLGDRFNGKVFVSGVLHQIEEGSWTVEVQFGMDSEWFAERVDINPPKASGLFSAVNGLQIGIVTQLEEDPEGEDRILVKVPIVDGKEQGVWARRATLDAGDSRGSYFLPEIGDEVVLGFIDDNPCAPVILGMLHSSAKPAPITAADDNFEKGFITKSELKFIFDDDKKSVLIETPGGKKICIDDNADSIEINDGSNKVVLSGDGILLESGSDINIKAPGDVNIEGMNVKVAANANLTAEGGAGAELSSGGNTVVKGSIVQIN